MVTLKAPRDLRGMVLVRVGGDLWVQLCGLFSTTVKDAGVSQWHHIQGEINAIHKLDRHYYGMFGFLASKDNSINAYSPNPESSLCIHYALQWLHRHNHLYKSFFSNYETL